ncbi:hypothetical protein N7478_005651 [Penicillium angulare]|uniref:uncharacterized protein n=1 Tax=Penicillium angulare TaxID=116970 RepID=UPI00254063D5|nr:uncharacterized protein N7478_005651 [Penicillium angulare]KAJ5280279.1 hypothetical protein N7478_005651 [Penicillium angulare]
MVSPSTWTREVQISLFSYGHANGPIVQQHRETKRQKTLHYNIRHLPNPPRHLRVKVTGLSRRLQKEFLQNNDVEALLVKVQIDILNAVKDASDQLLSSDMGNEVEEKPETDQRCFGLNAHIDEGAALEAPDIDVAVTICCEEGHHRSVAFVEELSRRLAIFKNGDGCSHYWQLIVNVDHRDIADFEDGDQSQSQRRRPNKSQSKSRQKERQQRGQGYKMKFENDDAEG